MASTQSFFQNIVNQFEGFIKNRWTIILASATVISGVYEQLRIPNIENSHQAAISQLIQRHELEKERLNKERESLSGLLNQINQEKEDALLSLKSIKVKVAPYQKKNNELIQQNTLLNEQISKLNNEIEDLKNTIIVSNKTIQELYKKHKQCSQNFNFQKAIDKLTSKIDKNNLILNTNDVFKPNAEQIENVRMDNQRLYKMIENYQIQMNNCR